jgi:hypothetical protein
MTSGFRFPGGDARTTIIGATGSGKSTCGIWMLSAQRFDKRPWIAIDPKREEIFDAVGFPPIRPLGLNDPLPTKRGLYLVSPVPGQEDALEAFLWRIWRHENIGVYVDEAALMPDGSAFRAILQQGRSRRIPCIACTQRPVSVARGLFSEANFVCVYRMVDRRDYKVVEGFVPGDLSAPLPRHCWRWYDRENHTLLNMAPVPPPATIAAELNRKIPYTPSAWHPFAWTGRPTGRAAPTVH